MIGPTVYIYKYIYIYIYINIEKLKIIQNFTLLGIPLSTTFTNAARE